jgi:hypothetical protein
MQRIGDLDECYAAWQKRHLDKPNKAEVARSDFIGPE